MAGSFSNAKVLSGLISKAISRRGFSSAAPVQGVVARSGAAVKKTGEEAVKSEKVAWIPDPRTGFYRPENMEEKIDVAELRAILLKKH